MEKYIVEKKETPKSLCGDSYRYKTEKGEISCVHPCEGTCWTYEIYSISGNLFWDVERFNTLWEAEARINELLL